MRKPLFFLLVPLLCFTLMARAQDKGVSGTILSDDDGSPMPGVTITNSSTGKRVQTNTAGVFTIDAVKGQKLTITFVGYVTQEVTIGDNNRINLRLVANNKELGNVVVTAYGQTKNKREVAYQAPTVSGEELAQTRRSNFLNALAGRVPGLTVTSTSGMPGASAQVILRGGVSIGGNNSPLYVVDGLPQNNGSLDQNDLAGASSTAVAGAGNLALANRNTDYTNRISDLNPEDIESVTILKGPEATALYGSDGASGAIVITTKKAKSGRTSITYSNNFAMSEVYRYPQIQQVYSRGSNGVYDPTAVGSYGFYFFGPKYAP
ncbi:MAG: TonB-dependent receptor plug domain-containing protein, partial [Bacteroidetes bacterium]|nr:TonB-dependent receptor plug domain-containing protein [Bacteroidota bacterium]